jgi:hypothetical protein
MHLIERFEQADIAHIENQPRHGNLHDVSSDLR